MFIYALNSYLNRWLRREAETIDRVNGTKKKQRKLLHSSVIFAITNDWEKWDQCV